MGSSVAEALSGRHSKWEICLYHRLVWRVRVVQFTRFSKLAIIVNLLDRRKCRGACINFCARQM